MASTFFGLTISTSGLYTANSGIITTAHNMANENTEGYSRQVATQEATSALKVYQSYGMVGSGVEIKSIEQMRNTYYDVKYWVNNANYGEQDIKNNYNFQIEDYFNEIEAGGFTTEYENLFNSLKELEGKSEESANRIEVLNYMQSIADYFNDIQIKLSDLQQECNTELSNKVDEINTLSEQIAGLTKQINTVELAGKNANDLRDQRNLLVDQLSAIIPITVKEQLNANNQMDYTVKINGYKIVDTYSAYKLKVVSRENTVNDTDIGGLYDVYYNYDERSESGTKLDIEAMDLTGEIRGIIDIRDGDNGTNVNYKGIPHYMKRVQDFKEAFAELFNNVHHEGYNLYGDKADSIDVYVIQPDGKLVVNEELLKDPKLLATSTEPIHEGVANAGIVDKWIELQDAPILQNAPAQEYLQSIVSEIGVSTKKTEMLLESYENIGQNIENQRLSVSGVDGDEETMNLVKYREAYVLSARMIQTMTELFNKLINETGV